MQPQRKRSMHTYIRPALSGLRKKFKASFSLFSLRRGTAVLLPAFLSLILLFLSFFSLTGWSFAIQPVLAKNSANSLPIDVQNMNQPAMVRVPANSPATSIKRLPLYQTDNSTDTTNISNSSANSTSPCLTLGVNETPYFVWEENNDIYFKKLGDSTIYNVSNSPTITSTNPAIAVDSSGVIHVVWREHIVDPLRGGVGEIYYAQSANGGALWSSAINLSSPYIPRFEYNRDFAIDPQIIIGPYASSEKPIP